MQHTGHQVDRGIRAADPVASPVSAANFGSALPNGQRDRETEITL